MRSSVWNYRYFILSFLFLTEFREFNLLLEGEGHSSSVRGVPVKPNTDIDPMSYLRNYGYLPRSDLETHEMRSIGEFQSALRRFQRMTGIKETGKLDSITIAMMRRPRCGRPDVAPQEFRIGPSRWEKMNLTYRILSYTGDLDANSVDKAFDESFRIWSSVTPLNFRKIFHGEADMMMSFDSLRHGDGYPFDGTGGVLAHAFPPGDGRGGDIHFDDDESWTKYSDEGTNLFMVATHEIGHSLGLLHSLDQRSLMYPVYQGYQRSFSLSNDDIQGIQWIYGSRLRPKPAPDGGKVTPGHRVPQTPPSPRSPAEGDDALPHLCSAELDAVASIRSEIFAFHGKWFWRIRRDDTSPAVAHPIASFWKGFPNSIDRVDAVFENPTSGRIFFFSGSNYWEFEANRLVSSGGGRSLRHLGLPQSVQRIDAAFVWQKNRQIYVFTGDTYWGIDPSGRRTEREYPRGMEMWTGLPFPVNAAFTHFDNRTYFIQGSQFWKLQHNAMQVETGYPQKTKDLWRQCKNTAAAATSRISRTSIRILYAAILIFTHTSLISPKQTC